MSAGRNGKLTILRINKKVSSIRRIKRFISMKSMIIFICIVHLATDSYIDLVYGYMK